MSSTLSVSNGKVVDTSTTTTTTATSNSTLDKNAFLQLLVTQMKYQDPLNPSTDTEYVAQLATFSQLEQMQNLNSTMTNNQAFGLVGMKVDVQMKNATGTTSTIQGTVDYVVLSNGTAKLSINGSLYTLDQIQQVYDSTYILKQGLPKLSKSITSTFDKDNPQDLTFEVFLGSGDTVATDVAFIINENIIDSKYVTLDGNKVTISKEAFTSLPNGVYKPVVMFNDSLYTAISNQITLTVQGTENTTDEANNNTDTKDGNDDSLTGDDAE